MFISVRKVNTSKRGEDMHYVETATPLHRLVNSAMVREVRELKGSDEHCVLVISPPSGPEQYVAVEGGMLFMANLLSSKSITTAKVTPHMPPPTTGAGRPKGSKNKGNDES